MQLGTFNKDKVLVGASLNDLNGDVHQCQNWRHYSKVIVTHMSPSLAGGWWGRSGRAAGWWLVSRERVLSAKCGLGG